MNDATIGSGAVRALDVFANGRLDAARGAAAGDAHDAAVKFEELLATQLMREMRRSLSEGFFGDGPGAEVYEGWLDEHLGKELARRGDLGLAQAVESNLNGSKARS